MSDRQAPPKGWKATTLGALGKYVNGRAFKSTEWSTKGRPIIRIQDLTGSNNNPNYFAGEVERRHTVLPGDLLISWSASLGAYLWDGPEAVLNQHIFKVESAINKRFHYHLARATIAALERRSHGSGMVHVTKRVFEDTPVVVPDDPHLQEKLADSIDAVEAISRSALLHLLASRRALHKLHQSILAVASSGQLTECWRLEHPDVEPANELLARIRSARQMPMRAARRNTGTADSDAPLPFGWTWTTVGALVDVATGATPLRKRRDYYGGDIPWITSSSVNDGIVRTCSEYITSDALRETNAKVFPPGTLIVAMYGEGQTRGRVAELGIAAATNQAVAALLFDDSNEVLRPYLKLFFLQNYQTIRRESFGGVQPNLSLGVIRDTRLPLPPLDEQCEIVRIVNDAMGQADSIERVVQGTEAQVRHVAHLALNDALGVSVNGV